MATEATGEVETLEWQESTWDGRDHTDVSGRKDTHATVRTRWSGALQGESREHWLMTYLSDEHAEFVGLEHVTGTLEGREGAFVAEHRGTFRDGSLRSSWSVVEGSGAGALEGLAGHGTFVYGTEEGEAPRWTFSYALPNPT